jgi:hypothetical protein
VFDPVIRYSFRVVRPVLDVTQQGKSRAGNGEEVPFDKIDRKFQRALYSPVG